MKPYQGLRNLCTLWLVIAIGTALVLIAIGLIGLFRGELSNAIYIIYGAAIILVGITIEQIISLLIDIAQGIQQLNERRPKTPPQVRN